MACKELTQIGTNRPSRTVETIDMMSRRTFLHGAAVLSGSGFFPGHGLAAGGAASAGYFYPDEAMPHERTFMQWPVNTQIHEDPAFLQILQKTISDIANKISEFEPVVMMMAKDHETAARKLLGQKVEIWDIPTDDLWARDSGPSFVIDGKGGIALAQLNFNGWGNKQIHNNDGKIAAKVAERLGLKVFDTGLVGEAGGVESDGKGMLIAHESSWINPNRNKGSKAEVEAMLKETMGASQVIWAPGVSGADITDYHIDALARFMQPGVVLIQLPGELDEEDPWSKSANETYDALSAIRLPNGEGLELIIIPEPNTTRVKSDGFVSSYVNYYVCNGAVIAAEFGDPDTDAEAKATLAALYKGREVATLNIDPIGEVGGGIHCATHQQPKV
jgi:agmatine deiminase